MAVYTEVSQSALADHLRAFDLGAPRELRGIAQGVENSNYLLTADAGRFILTLYEKRVAAEDLPYFLGLMEHLAASGIPCPTPVHARDGSVLATLCGRPSAIVTFLSGTSLARPTPMHCHEVGRALAALHLAGQHYRGHRANDLGVRAWRPLFLRCGPAAAIESVVPGLAGEIGEELAQFDAAWPSDLPSGVIHADLFPDNVFFQGDGVSGVIDFYFACNDQLAYDLAIAMNAWCFEVDGQFNVTKARQLLSGYQAVRALQADEVRALPLLARGAAMRFLLTRLYDWLHRVDGALVTPKDPLEYLHILRFHRGLDGPGAYGLDVPAA